MQNEAGESVKVELNKSKERGHYLLRNASFLAIAALGLVASSYIWQSRFLPSSEDLEDNYDYAEFVEASRPLPSLVPDIPLEKLVLISRLININHELTARGSQIPTWFVAANRQQVLPSPKRIVDVVIEDENDDSLVVRDRVVVIPKTLKINKNQDLTQIASSKSPAVQEPIAQVRVKTEPYTIQLMASFRQDDLMRFVNKHNIQGVKIRLTERDNVDWYVLTIGEYPQIEQAREAIKNLPTDLARFYPWVRPVAALKEVG